MFRECLVDTACSLPLLFPRRDWLRFQSVIPWISPATEATLPTVLRASVGAAEGVIPYRLGFIELTLWDLARHVDFQLPPLLAAFALTDALTGEPLVGLGGGILNLYRLYLALFLQRSQLAEY